MRQFLSSNFLKKLALLAGTTGLLGNQAWAQDPQYSQFFAAPLYHNPALAGGAFKGRFIGNARMQWPSIPGAFSTASFSYDQFFKQYNSGIGFIATRDKQGTGGLVTTSIAAQYSYQVNLTEKWSARGGLNFGYGSRSINWSKLTFPNQLNNSGVAVAPDIPPIQSANYFDAGAGALVYSRYFWAGLSALHMNRPNQALVGGSVGQLAELPMRINLTSGITIPLEKRMYGRGYNADNVVKSITPTLLYKRQGNFQQLDIGAYFTVSPLILGMWYRGLPVLKVENSTVLNQDALVFLVGFKREDLSIGYSYDLTIGRLGPGTQGAHEISISYEFDTPQKRRRKFSPIPCPRF